MHWHFGPFRLDLANACLWHAEQMVILRPKTFAVLVYLVTHAGQLVTKEALFDAIWPETAVGDGVLKTSMNELRKALGETAKAPQWIATVYRWGYRFVAPLTLMESAPPTGGLAGSRCVPVSWWWRICTGVRLLLSSGWRIWQGKRVAAQQLLGEVYGWFTEGFETADLQEAGMLLEELA